MLGVIEVGDHIVQCADRTVDRVVEIEDVASELAGLRIFAEATVEYVGLDPTDQLVVAVLAEDLARPALAQIPEEVVAVAKEDRPADLSRIVNDVARAGRVQIDKARERSGVGAKLPFVVVIEAMPPFMVP